MSHETERQQWLDSQLGTANYKLTIASADASFRHYYRIEPEQAWQGQSSLILMDAPPAHEDCRPFIKVAELFAKAGVAVPKIFATDLEKGFLLLTDFGDTTYLKVLDHENQASAHNLYAEAIGSLISIQSASRAKVLPNYDHGKLLNEMQLFQDWYINRHKNQPLDDTQKKRLAAQIELIASHNLMEGKVFVHRDYHSRNLMINPHQPGLPAIIDFQDAVYGPISYDLASLLKDAYIAWDEAFVLDLLARYHQTAKKMALPVPADFAQFHQDFEWMGVQRHLKILGIFARLAYRDGKLKFLDDLPVVLSYLRKTTARYSELKPLSQLLDQLDPVVKIEGMSF